MTRKQPNNFHGPPGTHRLKLNIEDYREEIDQLDFTEEQKIEFLETLWNIMKTFVDLGFGVDSVQMCLPEKLEKAGEERGGLIRARHTRKNKKMNREDSP